MKLFISYSRENREWCMALYEALRAEDSPHDPWIDARLEPTVDWWKNILSHIETCDCFIYILTPASVSSIYCEGELNYAVKLNKPVFPIMLEPANYPIILNWRRIQYATVHTSMDITRVLLLLERGLSNIREDMAKGKYKPPPKRVERPELPRQQFKETKECIRQGDAYYLKGEYAKAINIYEQGAPEYMILHARLALAWFKLGFDSNAEKRWEFLVKLDGKLRDAQYAARAYDLPDPMRKDLETFLSKSK